MTAEWFKRTTDVLADQLFALQLIRLYAAECNRAVTSILDTDRTCDGVFLALSELQECRRQLVDRFDECPTKFRWNVLYCLCAIESLVLELYVDDKHPERVRLAGKVMTQAANTRDLDALISERLLFDFFWRTDEDLLVALRIAVASTGFLCTQRSLPPGSVFAPIPCSQCRFDHAFSPESEIFRVTCTHLAGSIAPLSPDEELTVPDLPTAFDNDDKVGPVTACHFPVPDRAFDHLSIPDDLAEFVASSRSSNYKSPPAAKSIEDARGHLMSSKALRDCKEERAELVDIRSVIKEVATRRREVMSCKGLSEWNLLRLVNIIDAVARRCWWSNRARESVPIVCEVDRVACNRLQENLRSMVLQDTEHRHLCNTFNDLVLDPLTRDRQRIFRPYIDSRKLMYAVGIAPSDILAYDRSIAEVTNKTVFDLQSCDPRDQFFKAVFVSGLFRLYLNSIGCDAKSVPTLFRADDRAKLDGFCFAIDGSGILSVMGGHYFAKATNDTVLPMCIAWIRELLAQCAAGEATDSLTHLLEVTTI